MEDESVNIIRETTRDLIKHNRRFLRDQQSDSRRCVENISISAATITDIANKLKTKSSISVTELQTLKNGLLEDPKYIELVLQVHGALRGIIREFTGHEVKKQVEAAGCLCNLALGDSRATLSLANNAGVYLVAALDSAATETVVPSVWALGNMANSPRSCEILMKQGAMSKLCELLSHSNEEVKEAAMYSVVHFCYTLQDYLRQDHLLKILQSLSSLPITISSSQLLFILSCHKDFNIHLLPEVFLKKILEQTVISIKEHNESCTGIKVCCKLVYLVRTLANLVSNELCGILCNLLLECLVGVKLVLSKDSLVSKSMLWFLGNLYNCNSNNNLFIELLK